MKKWLVLIYLIVVALMPISVFAVNPVVTITISANTVGIADFTITYVSNTQQDLSWTFVGDAANVMIRAKYGDYPADIPDEDTAPTDGYLVYYGSGVTASDTTMDFDENAGPLYYVAWAQKADGTWYMITSRGLKESAVMTLIAFLAFGAFTIFLLFKWMNPLSGLVAVIAWAILAFASITDPTSIGLGNMDPTIVQMISYAFIAMTIIGALVFFSRMGKKQITRKDSAGQTYTEYGRPEKAAPTDRAKLVQENRRRELRAVVDRHSRRR